MDTHRGRESLTSRYLAALLAPAVMAGVMQVTWPFFEHNLVSPYLLAVIFCAWYGGLGPGLLSVVISLLLIDYFFIEPYFFFWFRRPTDVVRLMLLAVVGALISVMSELMYRATRRAEINLESVKRAERSLREKERFANQIAELSPVVINVLDLATRRDLYISPDVVNLLGYTPKEILEMEDPFSVLWHPEDIPRASEKLAQMKHARDGEIAEVEYRIRHRDVEWRWIASRTMPFERDENGIVRQIISASVDITERKRMEEALRERSEVLQAIFDHIPVMLCFIDQTGRMKLANREFERVFGWTLAEIRRHPDMFAEWYPDPDYRAGVLAFIRESTGKFAEFQTRTRSGAVIPTSFANVFLADGTSIGIGLDITERKRAEEAQREAEQKYRDIFDNALEGIFQTSPEGRFVVANPALARMFGFDSPEELIRERADISKQHYVDPKRREEFKRLLEVTGIVHHFDYEAYRKDGSRIWVSANVRAVRDETGKLLCYEGIAKDITERKRAEEALRESEERYRELFENAKDATYVHDLSGRYTSVNRAAEKLTGHSREEIVGRRFTDFVPPEQIEVISEQLCRKLVDEGETTYETEVIARDGSRVPVEVSSHLIYQNGVSVGVQGTARDITERKRAEELLRIKEQRFRSLIENSSDAIALFSANGQVLYASPSTPTVIGFAPEQLLRFTVFELVHPEDQKAFAECFTTLLKAPGMRMNLQVRVRHKDGSWRWLEGTLTNLLEQPDIGAIVNNYRDITERRRAEDDLRQQKEILQKIFDHIPVMIRLAGPDGDVQLVNREYERTMGWSLEELQKKNLNIFELYPDRQEQQVILDRIVTAKGGWADFKTKVRDGRIIDTSWTTIHLSAGMNLGIGQDISERKRAEEMLQSYSRQLIEAQESERQHIARELHDQIGQVLTAVRINLQTIWNSCDVPASRSLIDEGIAVIDKALEQVRDLSFELRPSLLDDLGLSAALRWCADRFAHRTMIQTRSTISLQDRMRLKPELETACYRIVQEALTNVARHARARNVAINLGTLNREIFLSIKDDGIGFDAPFPKDGSSPIRLGLRGMRERALALGGRLEIESASSVGTEIRAYFPNGSKKNE